jgi:hypothetical protein
MKKVLFILIFMTTPVLAQEKVDYVNLGATLLKDGYIQRAKTVLEKADVTRKDFDFARYYSLKGILLHKLSYPALSNIFIDEAIKRGQDNPSILLYEAKNYWLLQDYPKVIDTLNKAGDAARESPQFFVIKAESFKQQDMIAAAWAVLDEGISLFPDAPLFYRQKFYYLLDLGFYKTALKYAQKYLQSKNYSAKDYLAVAYTLRENQQLKDSAALLEEAVIKYSDDDKLIELLGQVYIDQGKYIMAALVFDWAAIKHPKFAQKAATLYLKAKQPIRSLQLNRRIANQKDKFKQRLGIDLYLEDYETLVTETTALKRYDLLKDDNILYAIGYGYYQIGDYANAKKYLKQISDSQLFAKASNIFQQIEKCQGEPFECY